LIKVGDWSQMVRRHTVARPRQSNTSQQWYISPIAIEYNLYAYWVFRMGAKLYMDADATNGGSPVEMEREDFRVIIHRSKNSDPRYQLRGMPQTWLILPQPNNAYRIVTNFPALTNTVVEASRYLDAHQHSNKDFRAVTRPYQNNLTQFWNIAPAATTSPFPSTDIRR